MFSGMFQPINIIIMMMIIITTPIIIIIVIIIVIMIADLHFSNGIAQRIDTFPVGFRWSYAQSAY